MGPQTDKHAAEAQGIALLNVAESFQLMQLQLVETAKEVRLSISSSMDSLKEVISTHASTVLDQAKGAAWLSVALIVATVVLALFTGFQGLEILGQRDDMQKVSSANLALGFADRLDQGTYKQIIDTIETTHVTLLKPAGKFTSDQLEQLLAQYDAIGELSSEGLINTRTSYDLFSYDVIAAYNNTEIRDYLVSLRKDENDQSLYDMFDYLAKSFSVQDKPSVTTQAH